jgi:hypothetical protein
VIASKRFYPRGCSSAKDRLRYYATQFPVVEVDTNNPDRTAAVLIGACRATSPLDPRGNQCGCINSTHSTTKTAPAKAKSASEIGGIRRSLLIPNPSQTSA